MSHSDRWQGYLKASPVTSRVLTAKGSGGPHRKLAVTKKKVGTVGGGCQPFRQHDDLHDSPFNSLHLCPSKTFTEPVLPPSFSPADFSFYPTSWSLSL